MNVGLGAQRFRTTSSVNFSSFSDAQPTGSSVLRRGCHLGYPSGCRTHFEPRPSRESWTVGMAIKFTGPFEQVEKEEEEECFFEGTPGIQDLFLQAE